MSAALSFIDKLMYAVLSPLTALPWGISIALTSLVFSVVFVFAYRAVSSQERIKAARNSIRTAILEAVVFRRDAKVCLRAQASLLWGGLRYLGLAVVPVLILLIPGAVLLSRMYLAIGVEPLHQGSTFLVHGQVADPSSLSTLELSSNAGLVVGPIVRSPKDSAFIARVAVTGSDASGEGTLTVKTATSKGSELPVKLNGSTASPKELTSRVTWESVLVPSGQQLLASDGAVTSMWIEYPERMASVLGHQISWLVLFVILTLAWGFGVAKAFGVAL